ncbi:MAG: hypothetical protein O4804_06135 [Trichodesmium sp. St11_bin5]|nr:hypothetical protein [Trichodesmium sp. St11_bin5]
MTNLPWKEARVSILPLLLEKFFSEYTEIHCATHSLWPLDISFTSA